MLHIAKYRGTSYVSHVSANIEVKNGKTCSPESSYHPKTTVIYTKSCKVDPGHDLIFITSVGLAPDRWHLFLSFLV